MNKIYSNASDVIASCAARTVRRRTLPLIDTLEARTLFSTVTVANLNDSGAGSLRNAIATANANDVIVFAHGLHGTIGLTSGELQINKSLTIDGSTTGSVTVSGNNAARVLDITSGNVKVEINDLTIAHGQAATGAGIDNEIGATLSVNDCTFVSNEAVNTDSGGLALGGAIDNAGKLSVTDSAFTNNQALGGAGLGNPTASTAGGGAIYNENGGTARIENASFSGNKAVGGISAAGAGGALYNVSSNANAMEGVPTSTTSTLIVDNSTFAGNEADGGAGFGFALGGAIINFINGDASSAATAVHPLMTITGSMFRGNIAQGGSGGGYGVGGAVWNNSDFDAANISGSLFAGNKAIGGDTGGQAIGGGIANGFGGTLTVSNSILSGNQALGGVGDPALGGSGGGIGQGGGIANVFAGSLAQTTVKITTTLILGNQAIGGDTGGDAQGGGIYAGPATTTTLALSAVALNQALGGSGGGTGIGGGLYADNSDPMNPVLFTKLISFVAGNNASTSNNDIFGPVM